MTSPSRSALCPMHGEAEQPRAASGRGGQFRRRGASAVAGSQPPLPPCPDQTVEHCEPCLHHGDSGAPAGIRIFQSRRPLCHTRSEHLGGNGLDGILMRASRWKKGPAPGTACTPKGKRPCCPRSISALQRRNAPRRSVRAGMARSQNDARAAVSNDATGVSGPCRRLAAMMSVRPFNMRFAESRAMVLASASRHQAVVLSDEARSGDLTMA